MTVDEYAQLERERKPKSLRDWTALWNELPLLAETNGAVRANVEAFAASKRVTVESLEALGTRVKLRDQGRVDLAFAGSNGSGAIVAVKYRPLAGTSHDCYAENPSAWLRPIVAGNRDSLHWYLAEGETDGARLHGLVGEHAAVMVLPSGARAFPKEWAAVIPRGATVYTCHDADDAGDEGAAKVSKALDTTIRVRPPVEGGDWCDWPGSSDEFAQLVEAARSVLAQGPELVFTPLEAFAAVDEPGAEPLAQSADDHGTVIAAEGLVMAYGDGGAGKTTLCIDLCFALATQAPWLGIVTVDRPLRIAIIENEGPRQEFRKKLERKLTETGAQLEGRITVLEEPWEEFNFADETHRQAIAARIDADEVDLLVVGPLASVGAIGGGTPAEVEEFKKLLSKVRALCPRKFAVLLVHHENRSGQISGAWERLPDTLMHVTGQGPGRTRVYWQKVRWSSALHETTTHLLWAEGESYTVEEKPEVTEDTMISDLITAVQETPGASWTKIRERVTGKATDVANVRDRLLAEGVLINTAAREGYFNLWHCDDPAAPRSHPGTAWERPAEPPRAGASETSRSAVPYVSRNGFGNGTASDVPEVDDDENGPDWSEWQEAALRLQRREGVYAHTSEEIRAELERMHAEAVDADPGASNEPPLWDDNEADSLADPDACAFVSRIDDESEPA
jgi:hypothetical protein